MTVFYVITSYACTRSKINDLTCPCYRVLLSGIASYLSLIPLGWCRFLIHMHKFLWEELLEYVLFLTYGKIADPRGSIWYETYGMLHNLWGRNPCKAIMQQSRLFTNEIVGNNQQYIPQGLSVWATQRVAKECWSIYISDVFISYAWPYME